MAMCGWSVAGLWHAHIAPRWNLPEWVCMSKVEGSVVVVVWAGGGRVRVRVSECGEGEERVAAQQLARESLAHIKRARLTSSDAAEQVREERGGSG